MGSIPAGDIVSTLNAREDCSRLDFLATPSFAMPKRCSVGLLTPKATRPSRIREYANQKMAQEASRNSGGFGIPIFSADLASECSRKLVDTLVNGTIFRLAWETQSSTTRVFSVVDNYPDWGWNAHSDLMGVIEWTQ